MLKLLFIFPFKILIRNKEYSLQIPRLSNIRVTANAEKTPTLGQTVESDIDLLVSLKTEKVEVLPKQVSRQAISCNVHRDQVISISSLTPSRHILHLIENLTETTIINVGPIQELAKTAEIRVEISSVSLIEMELIYQSEKLEHKLLEHLAAIAALSNVKYIPLTPDVAVASVYLRQTLNLTFFDSHHAATALNSDRKIISFYQAYDKVSGLTRIKPETI